MGKKRKELTHEEIWDDTGLIESWNASYEEYKLYHSIHARGENLDEALAAADGDDKGAKHEADKHSTQLVNTTNEPDMEEGLYQKHQDGQGSGDVRAGVNSVGSAMQKPVQSDHGREGQEILADGNKALETDYGGPNGEAEQMKLPATNGMINQLTAQSSQDQALNNLMMSWYWAGYYTGLYEGQQKANGRSNQQ